MLHSIVLFRPFYITAGSHNVSLYAQTSMERGMKIEQRFSERHGLSQGTGYLDHDWHHRANRPYFDVGGHHEWYAHPSAAIP